MSDQPRATLGVDNATESAQILQHVVSKAAFPQQAADDLARLLGHSLATESSAQRRFAKLGLLIRLVAETNAEFITSVRYEQARLAQDDPSSWPTAPALSRAYGHWLMAVKATCRYWFDGGIAAVPSSYEHAGGPKRGYQPQEIVSALIRCQRDLGLPQDVWPTEWEYFEWARINRRLLRRSGAPCRLPGRKQFRAAFGGYAEAVAAARQLPSG